MKTFKKHKNFRLTPYTKKGHTVTYGREDLGYVPFQGINGNTNRSKEIKNNANRSMKKGARQESKKQIKIELENYDTE